MKYIIILIGLALIISHFMHFDNWQTVADYKQLGARVNNMNIELLGARYW